METSDSNRSGRKKTRVMIVEDHPIVRHGLTMLIDDQADMAVCGGVESAKDAITHLREFRPTVVLVDIVLGDANGLDLMKQMHQQHPDLPVLVISMHDEAVYAERALRAGAKGYIMKSEPMDKLLTAIRQVAAGEIWVSERMSSRLLNKMISPRAGKGASPIEALTDREFEVFRLIAKSIGPSEIAQRLSVSVKTVETHREHIKAKLGLKSGAELTRFSLQWAMEHA